MRRHGKDRQHRSEVGHQTRRTAGFGRDDDGARLHVERRAHRGQTDRAVDRTDTRLVRVDVQAVVLGHRGLGDQRDVGHHLQGLERILARGRLAGKHGRIGAVVDGVGHVGHLGARRARVADHRVEHLGRGDDGLIGLVALLDDLLLDGGAHLGRHLDAQVAAGDHDAVGLLQDVIEVVDGHGAFDLREDVDVLAAVLIAQLADLAHAGRVADEGRRDEIDALFQAEQDVLAVLLGDGGQRQLGVRDVHALLLAQLAAVLDIAGYVLARDALDREPDQAVVDQDRASHMDLARKLEVIQIEMLGVALQVLRGLGRSHRDGRAGLERHLGMTLQKARADLGPLGVEQDAHRDAELAGDALDALHARTLLLVAAVREIETGDVHARLDHLAEDIVVITSRSHGANDLCTLIHAPLHLS